jgi:hypothetical protein
VTEPEGRREALKRVAVVLKQAGISFALGGGYAAWAHGSPEPEHDVDFLILEDNAEQARAALVEAGLRVEQPPEDWLFKVFTDGAMVDVLFRSAGFATLRPMLDRAETESVLSVRMPVLTATDVMACKLNALNEHQCDLARLLPVARAVREQVDWASVREVTAGNDFAVSFLVLLERLGVAPPAGDQALPVASEAASRPSPSSTETEGEGE